MKSRWQERIAKWRSIQRKAGLSMVLCFGMVSFGGCSYWSDVMSPYGDMQNSALCCFRGKLTAKRLWNEKYSHCYGNAANAKDIRQGFIDGFVETCNGGNGCTPLVPPNHYCGIGRKPSAAAWFQGYPLGVAAAESSGACGMGQTALSPALAACIKQDTCTPGCIPCQPGDQHVMVSGDPLFEAIEAGGIPQPALIDPNSAPVPEPIEDTQVPPAPDAERDSDDNGDETKNIFDREVDEPELEQMDNKKPELDPAEDRDIKSPADRPAKPRPADAIKKAIDDVTQTPNQNRRPKDVTQPNASDFLPSNSTPMQELVQRNEKQVVPNPIPNTIQAPVERVAKKPLQKPFQSKGRGAIQGPVPDAIKQSIEDVLKPSAPVKPPVVGEPVKPISPAKTVDPNAPPVVSGPIELPNIQVSFDWEGVDWLFGEVNLADALLQKDFPSVLDEE